MEIRSKFPEVSKKLDEWMKSEGWKREDNMHTAEMEQFSQITTDSLKENNRDQAERYLQYISKKLDQADEIEKEYIDVYFVESLMWNDSNNSRRKKCWELMPFNLQKLYSEFWGRKLYDEE